MCLRTCGGPNKTSAAMKAVSARVAIKVVTAGLGKAEAASARVTRRTRQVCASPIFRTLMSKSSSMTKQKEKVFKRP